jgi:glucose/arabinose dehydrogenase
MKIFDSKILIATIIISMFLIPAFGQTYDDKLPKTPPPEWQQPFVLPLISQQPNVLDTDFDVEEFTTGLIFPTTMSFIDNDILVLQKNDGHVRHVLADGTLLPNAVLDVEVSNYMEGGLLGIISKNIFVYLYYTESIQDGGDSIGNNIYKYRWVDNKLQDPILLKSLPAYPDVIVHHGGVMTVGKDGTVYAIIGDQDQNSPAGNILQNQFGPPDDTGVILPIEPIGPYYAIGIRNSFGLTIDPVTGNMWATETGPYRMDEVNLIMPKFNSGWNAHSGPIAESETELLGTLMSHIQLFLASVYSLFFLTDSYEYSDPEFSWEKIITPTALNFAPSSFGKYENWLFVGDCGLGNIYKFKLNSDRNGFVFEDFNLNDLVLHEEDDIEEIIFGKGFGCITDIEIRGDDMYVVSIFDGTIYRIFLKDLL